MSICTHEKLSIFVSFCASGSPHFSIQFGFCTNILDSYHEISNYVQCNFHHNGCFKNVPVTSFVNFINGPRLESASLVRWVLLFWKNRYSINNFVFLLEVFVQKCRPHAIFKNWSARKYLNTYCRNTSLICLLYKYLSSNNDLSTSTWCLFRLSDVLTYIRLVVDTVTFRPFLLHISLSLSLVPAIIIW